MVTVQKWRAQVLINMAMAELEESLLVLYTAALKGQKLEEISGKLSTNIKTAEDWLRDLKALMGIKA